MDSNYDNDTNDLEAIIARKPSGVGTPVAAPVHPDMQELQSILDRSKAPEVTADTPWTEVGRQAIGNAPESAWNVVKSIPEGVQNLAHASMHPVQTGQALGNVDWGTVGSQLKHDYLTEEGWKQAIAHDPLSRLMDVGMAMAGPEALAERSGIKALELAGKAARYGTDPATWLTGGISQAVDKGSKLLNEVVGEAGTHTGGHSLNLSREAGRESSEMANANLRGIWKRGASVEEIVNAFRQAARNQKQAAHDRYRSGMIDVSADNHYLPFDDVTNALKENEKRFGQGTRLDPKVPTQVERDTWEARNALHNAVYGHIQNLFDTGNPVFSHPIGFDELKHRIDSIYDTLKLKPGTESYAAVTAARDAITKTLDREAPVYSGVMKDYKKSYDALRAYDKELSLANSNPDTAARKLFSSMRSNVATGFLRRNQLTKELAKDPIARKALYDMSGQYNSTFWPRGLVGMFKTGLSPWAVATETGGYFLGHPAITIPLATMQSPKLMATFNNLQGRAERVIGGAPWRGIIYGGHSASPFSLPPEGQQ